MKCNDTAGEFCMLYVEPGDDKAALFATIEGQKKPVVIMLPEQTRGRIFQRPEDFTDLKHVKRQLDVPIIFVMAGNEHLRQLAARHGFPAYVSIDSLYRALSQGQLSLSRQRTLAKTGPLNPPGRGISARKTVPLVPMEPSDFEADKSAMGAINRPLQPLADQSAMGAKDGHTVPRTASLLRSASSRPLQPLSDNLANGYNRSPRFTASDGEPKAPSPRVPHAKKSTSSLPPVAKKKRRGGFPAVLVLLFLMVLGGAGMGSFLLFYRQSPTGSAPVPKVVGRIYFLSSEQVSENSSQGIDDEIQIDLHTLSNPAPGKSYYAWLLGDKDQSESKAFLLGQLLVNKGNAHLFYAGDAHHTNLLELTSRLLITEEDASTTPITPTPDYSSWRYYGEFSQVPDPRDAHHYSFLNHLRHLLASDPVLNEMELPGGLNSWFYRNTGKLLEWTVSARDSWEETKDMEFVRRQTFRTLSYLDGMSFVQQDVPPNIPMPGISRLASVGLLDVNGSNQNPASYLSAIVFHLTGLINAPGSPASVRTSAAQILTAMSNVRVWLEHVRDDARKIAGMTDDQLSKPGAFSLLNDIVEQAHYAYAGETDPTSGEVKEGVMWIHDQMQSLATFEVTQYIAGASPPEMIPTSNPLAVHLGA